MAEAYDVFAESVTRLFAEDAARLVRLGRGSRVIDVAAGTGAFTLAAARRGANVLATDFAPGMLAVLERRCAEQGLTTVKTSVMNGQALTVADSSFDVAASLFGLLFFPDHDQRLRVLKPGGQAVVTVWAPPPRGEMQQIFGRALTKAIPDLPEPDEPPHTTALGDVDDLRQRLLSSGFARAHVVSVTHVWAFESPVWLADRMTAVAPPAVAFFETLPAAQQAAFKQAVVEDFRERQDDGPYAVTNEGLIAVGTKGVGD